ncbi:hypothetical protein [Nakamurella leprariae]|uniref:Uncharacterized protein n=1 Tax=Nakamurella leprariae TaxID=2803911 RepID=A0A939BXR0_9ACTN|nr:hypothetical protein [Nakamurella leprariae]MBM9465851.1 hypothetical protein [Nakamurella leprariae]
MDWPGDEHPAVAAVRAVLAPDGQPLSVRFFQRRGTVAAVVAETSRARYPVIVTARDGRWVVPSLVSGTSQPAVPRQPRSAVPPKLMWDCLHSSDLPDVVEQPSAAVWAVFMGQAALDGRLLTVESDLDVQSCEVGEDGFVAVLFRSSRHHRPRLRMRTASGETVALFTGEPGVPR